MGDYWQFSIYYPRKALVRMALNSRPPPARMACGTPNARLNWRSWRAARSASLECNRKANGNNEVFSTTSSEYSLLTSGLTVGLIRSTSTTFQSWSAWPGGFPFLLLVSSCVSYIHTKKCTLARLWLSRANGSAREICPTWLKRPDERAERASTTHARESAFTEMLARELGRVAHANREINVINRLVRIVLGISLGSSFDFTVPTKSSLY